LSLYVILYAKLCRKTVECQGRQKYILFFSFCAFFYFVDNSMALLNCGVVGSEAELVRGDDVGNGYCFSGYVDR
jgi:hypothetical protein